MSCAVSGKSLSSVALSGLTQSACRSESIQKPCQGHTGGDECHSPWGVTHWDHLAWRLTARRFALATCTVAGPA